MKKETEVGKIGYLLYCDGTQCKRCLNAFVCRQLRGLDEKDIQEICDNTEAKIMRALPQNMRDFAAKYFAANKSGGNKEEERK